MLIIQPSSGDEEGFLDKQIAKTEAGSRRAFILVSFHIDDWNKELSPWEAPAVFGNEGFGDGAPATLSYVTEELIPYIKSRYGLSDDTNEPMTVDYVVEDYHLIRILRDR